MHFLASAVRNGLQHFLLNKPHATVTAHVANKEKVLTIDPGIRIAKGDVQWVVLPEEWTVVSPDGETIEPSGIYLVTLETFDPCHMVTDVKEELVPYYMRQRLRRKTK